MEQANPPRNDHKTCATCKYAVRENKDLNIITCYGTPPTPVVLGVMQTPMGPQVNVECVRPNLPKTTRSCGRYEFRIAGGTTLIGSEVAGNS